MPKHILVFAPVAHWMVHHQLDCVIGAALRNRGCSVSVITCDGILDRCRVQGAQPDPVKCQSCQQSGNEWFTRFGLEQLPLSSLVTAEQRAAAAAWADGLDLDNYKAATFEGMAIGQWMLPLLHSALMTGHLDFTLPAVQERARAFAAHAVVLGLATRKALELQRPDHAICYSGANGYYRVFFELARAAGVRVLVHERGLLPGAFSLINNISTYEMQGTGLPGWDEWKDVPLSREQWRSTAQLLEDRSGGKSVNFQRIHRFESDLGSTRRRLRLPQGKKVLLALASGDWEFGMAKNYGCRHATFPTQMEFIHATAALCAKHGWQLVVRYHPLVAGTPNYPRGSHFLAQLLSQGRLLGPHVRVVMPAENLSTYDLLCVADTAVTQFSSTGADALVAGLPTLCLGDNGLRQAGIRYVKEQGDYEAELLAAMAKEPASDVEAISLAHRFQHFRAFSSRSTKFTSVTIKDVYGTDFRLGSPDELIPGVDPQLDRLCEHIMNGQPLETSPEQPFPPLADEREEAEATLARLRERRAAVANAPASALERVQVLSLGVAKANGEIPAGWASRHAEVEFSSLPMDVGGGWEAVRATLHRAASRADAPYLYFTSEAASPDEAWLSQATDLLAADAEKTGVLAGCYVLSPEGKVGPEWHTHVHPGKPDNLPPAEIEALHEPFNVLSLVVWRRERLLAWLEQKDATPEADHRWCGWLLKSFLDEASFISLREPMVYLTEGPSHASLLAEAERKAEAGDLAAALADAGVIARRFGYIHGLRTRMAAWLIKAERYAQAQALLLADMKDGAGDGRTWELLQKAAPQVLAGKTDYNRAFHSAVETVHGYMVPGQEKYLHDKVKSLPRDARILEIGSCNGRSTVAMGFACVGTERRILCLDTFEGNEGIMRIVASFYHKWRGNIKRWGLESYASARQGYSHPLLREMPVEPVFDFVFIDASHEYADVLLDFELSYPLVKPGGWIGFHDVEPGWPGSWRVWEQTGKPLLTQHQTCDTLACGQKQANVPWDNHERDWPGFRVAYARSILDDADLGSTAQALLDLPTAAASERSALEQRLAAAPERIRNVLLWGVTKEVENDPWLHYAVSLSQQAAAPAVAERHLAQAKSLGLALS